MARIKNPRQQGLQVFEFDMKAFAIKDGGWLLALGILGVLFSYVLFWNPLFAGLTIVFYTGCAFMTIGVFRIILSFKLKHLGQTAEALDSIMHD